MSNIANCRYKEEIPGTARRRSGILEFSQLCVSVEERIRYGDGGRIRVLTVQNNESEATFEPNCWLSV